MTTPTTDSLQTSIEYITKTLDYIRDHDLREIKNSIEKIEEKYATKLQLSEVKQELEERIEERTRNWNKVGSVVMIALVGIAISAFVYLVATHPLSLMQ